MESWAVDLKDVGAVYPWQGAELIMVLAGVAFWIWWHIAQATAENRQYEEEKRRFASNPEQIRDALDNPQNY